jgi:hypothetical protein
VGCGQRGATRLGICPVKFRSADSPKARFHRGNKCGMRIVDCKLKSLVCDSFFKSAIRNPQSEISLAPPLQHFRRHQVQDINTAVCLKLSGSDKVYRYCSFHSGFLFSRKASTPSSASSVLQRAAKSSLR